MAFLVGSKGIGTPTWGHSLKVDPYLWSSKLSFLYDIDYLRNIENLYGNEVLKQYILEKLKAIDKFDDCLVITDFTQSEELVFARSMVINDDATIERTEDELKITITTTSTSGRRYAWVYKDFSTEQSKLFFSCVVVPGPYHTTCEAGNDTGSAIWKADCYEIWIPIYASNSDFRIAKFIDQGDFTIATESVNLSKGTPYKVAGYFDVSNHIQKAWRESKLIDLSSPTLSATDTELTTIKTFRLRADTRNTSTTETYRWRVPLIVAWKS